MASSLRRKASRDELYLNHPAPNAPPPYYEVAAYPQVHSCRLRRALRIPLGLALVLTCAVSGLWLFSGASIAADQAAAPAQAIQFQRSLDKCASLVKYPKRVNPAERKTNPRWNAATGQTEAVILRNARLFDGEAFIPELVDIFFDKGLVVSVSATSSRGQRPAEAAREYDLDGQWVTPGLVDMHSHHGVGNWPNSAALEDANEMHPDFGPLTPFVRALDSLKAYDEATTLIASGGVTTSLVIPGSANIMGGEGTVLKNRLRSGPHKEPVVEELLLEHGIPFDERNRYMKMACGENPKGAYGHTRMGNAFVLRKHLSRAKALLEKQDTWCAAATRLRSNKADAQARFIEKMGGGYPEELELDSTVGMMRGRVAMHNHCYEPEDMETMLRISKEFGFRVRAFHHAISAWRVPEMLKEYGENVTVATFAEFSLYKWEAYDPSLYAGKVLVEHGVPLAYKSDHATEPTNAKYLLNQAATAHSFHVPADRALRSVTSVPAKAIDLDDRVGYVRPGYDADIVVWDSHPLSIGSTPRQVFIDGVATLDPAKVKLSMDDQATKSAGSRLAWGEQPQMRVTIPEGAKRDFCEQADKKDQQFVITGIRESFLENYPEVKMSNLPAGAGNNLSLVISNGSIACLGSSAACSDQIAAANHAHAATLNLANGFLTPGLTVVSESLGLQEISLDENTSNGAVSPLLSPRNRNNIDYAKYGIALDGKGFVRARMGGVTRAVTPPLTAGGLVRGVSAGFLTSGKRSLLDGGIFRGEVAVHVQLGELAKTSLGAVSFAVKELRELLELGNEAAWQGSERNSLFSSVIQGHVPLVVHAENKYDIQQIILLKKDLVRSGDSIKIVIFGGHEAPQVADELAKADISVILTSHRGSFSTFKTRDTLPGPPLSRSPASILSEAGVFYALTLGSDPPEGNSRIHDLVLEASWAAKYAGLSDAEAIQLVSLNVEEILGLPRGRDIVVWEGNPLQYGARPQLTFQAMEGGVLEVAACLPDEESSQ